MPRTAETGIELTQLIDTFPLNAIMTETRTFRNDAHNTKLCDPFNMTNNNDIDLRDLLNHDPCSDDERAEYDRNPSLSALKQQLKNHRGSWNSCTRRHLLQYEGVERRLFPLSMVCALGAPLGDVKLVFGCYMDAIRVVETEACGYTPLHFAIRHHAPLDVVDFLVSKYPEAAEKPSDDGSIPLHIACRYTATLDVVRLLIALYPETINKQANEEMTPLALAEENDAPSCVKKLLRYCGNELDPTVLETRVGLERAITMRLTAARGGNESPEEHLNFLIPFLRFVPTEGRLHAKRAELLLDALLGLDRYKQEEVLRIDEQLSKEKIKEVCLHDPISMIANRQVAEEAEKHLLLNEIRSLRQDQMEEFRQISNRLEDIAKAQLGCPLLYMLEEVPPKFLSSVPRTKRTFRLYFVCAHDRMIVPEAPIELHKTTEWVRTIAPAIQVTLIIARIVCATQGIPLPITQVIKDMGINDNKFLDAFAQEVKTIAQDKWRELETAAKYLQGETPQDKAIQLLEREREVSNEAYNEIENCASENTGWMNYMDLVANRNGHFAWVKKTNVANWAMST